MSYSIKPNTRSKKGGVIVDFYVVRPDGVEVRKKKRPPVSGKENIERWARQLEAQLLFAKTEEEVPTQTFKEFGMEYLRNKEADGEEVKPSYLQFMRYTINGHLMRTFGDLRLGQITTEKVDALRRALKEPRPSGKRRGDKGVNNVLGLLATMLAVAEEKKLITKAPTVVLLKKEKKAKRRAQGKIKADGINCYTQEQFDRLVLVAKNTSPEAALVFLLGGDAGLRRGEIIALKWSDVAFRTGDITVNHNIWWHAKKPHEGLPKGGCAREVPMTKALASALSSYKRAESPYILTRNGRPLNYADFRRIIRQVQKGAGFTVNGKAHVLRHTFCSRLAMRGTAIKVIQTLAGHANIETTERYLHSDETLERSAIAALDIPQKLEQPNLRVVSG